jgi:VanZ family protein
VRPLSRRQTPRNSRWWIGAGLYAGLILLASLVPGGQQPSVPHLDKAAHLCEYLLFAWLLVQAIRAGRLVEPEYLTLAWIYATSYGLLMELLQAFVPWRSADWADAVMNGLGAAAGIWIANKWPRRSVL